MKTTEQKRKEFIELTNEDPEDTFGPDWENFLDEFEEEEAE